VPFRISRFRLQRASPEEAVWLRDTLDRESSKFDTRVSLSDENSLIVQRRRGALISFDPAQGARP
jgi:poly-gamma-glutamate synthesis protein (capsule biosynthesis protein)